MLDWLTQILDALALFLGMPPWIVLVTLVFFITVLVGFRLVLRDHLSRSRDPHWNSDPELMEDLNPRLRNARRQMIAAAIAMIFIGIIAVLKLFE